MTAGHAAFGYHLWLAPEGDALHRLQGVVDAGDHRRRVLEEHVEVRDLRYAHLHHHRQAAGGIDHDGVRSQDL